jgi:type IV secretion system protein VirB10
MKNDQTKNEDGLPEIAQRLQEKKPIVLVMLGIILVASCSLFFINKPKKQIAPAVEENYAVQAVAQPDTPKSVPVVAQATNNEPIKVSQPNPEILQQQLALLQAKQDELKQRLSAPLMLVNNAQPNKPETAAQQVPTSGDSNSQFISQVSSQATETATATMIGSLNSIIAEGSLIHATLESATNSDLPGHIRAVVSKPCYSEDGTQVLIPAGSRLLGQYKSGMLQGQSRIFMVWTRLITPSGISIQLGSPGVDSLGMAGAEADEINRHFWERFGTGSLLSLIGAGAANAGVSPMDQENSASVYRSAIANSFSQSASQSLQQDSRIPPTLIQYQGKPIMVFVAKDLNFKGAIKLAIPKTNVF